MPEEVSKKRKPNKKSTSKASPSAIEVEKAYSLQKVRIDLGWTWFELSYMMGKDNGSYVRDVENPLHTLKYDPADVNYIALILNKTFKIILPPPVPAKNYNLLVTEQLDQSRRKVYEISLQQSDGIYTHYHIFTEERKSDALDTPLNTYEPGEVKSYMDALIADGFFDSPKTALDVLANFRKNFGEDFHPKHMITTLIDFCDGRKGKRLDDNGKDDCGRRVYVLFNPPAP
ncbi:hypothetical protein [Parapedobacter soli]|uniref:hypothetical protein n=1 Tax=Parapedobacter soli TaxID=416955 RepID=UPI0021CA9BAC|nr:hypothetical protein [Parapedobacter soli]